MRFPNENNQPFSFLQGGGEMGRLIGAWDWENNPLGPIEQWPLSLRTTLGILLHSAFPMFLFWGPELTCFYNDAYRPSLGENGKHPAIGKPAASVWPDIWHFIGPLIGQVMQTGKPVWFEDQYLPIFRNGKTEDVYWTFSYSPAYDDHGHINGVFVTCTETTGQVQLMQRLSDSEARFQTLVREATVGIIVLEGEHMLVKIVNDAYGKLINKTVPELLNKPLFSIIPETEPYYKPLIEKVRLSGEPFYLYETSYNILIDGNPKEGFLNVVYQPYRDEDGSVTGVMVLCQDITEQVVYRKKVEQSEQQVRSLVESAPFPIGVYEGREMRITLANPSIIDIWGQGKDVIGKLYRDVMPKRQGLPVYDQLDKVFTTGVPYHARNQRVDTQVDGQLQALYFNYSFTPLYNAAGNIYGVMSIAAETTDLNLIKQRVEQSEQNFRNMILQAPVAMCILVGPSHIVEVANQLMIKLWGKDAATVMHKPIFEGLPDAREQGLEQLIRDVYQTGIPFSGSERPVLLERNGKLETVYQNFVYEPYRDVDGSIIGVLAVSVDVTPQVLARQKIEDIVAERTQELAAANSNLQRSNEELAQFAYIASHDLQEPLRKVSSFAGMLEHSLDHISERSRGYLDKINMSTSRMAALIRDVLAYSQLAKENIVYEPVDLQKVIEDIKTDLELEIEQRQAMVIVEDLPILDAIPLQMSQLFANLLSNALKFTRKGEVPMIHIRSELLEPEEISRRGILALPTPYYLLEVSDNGIGFSAEHAEQIFNIFQRLHGKTEYSGTGIGLAICKKIAQNHHGDIYATSSGSGATFSIILPAKHQVARA